MKYYQQSLAKLEESMTDEEKEKIKKESKKLSLKHNYFGKVFPTLPSNDQEWILKYMSSGKGVIPYEMTDSFDSLNIVPKDEYFFMEDFYSSLKHSVITEEEHSSVKKLYSLLKMENLGDLNNLHNFQDTIILCEIIESRSDFLNNRFKFNLRKCNSVSSFSGCVQRDESKCIIALPTCAEHVELFEKTLIGGCSCVNTILAFDLQILLPNDNKQNLKILYNQKIDGK